MTATDIECEPVGTEFHAPARVMHRERMRWYCDALETAAEANGGFVVAGQTIHSDDEYARSQGLPGIISDGMITTNWISGLLVRAYGLGYVAHGSLSTKFIRPVFEDEVITTHAKIVGYETTDDGAVVSLDVWCAKADGQICTVGSATARVGAGEVMA